MKSEEQDPMHFQTPMKLGSAVTIDRDDLVELVEQASAVWSEGSSEHCRKVRDAVNRVAPGYLPSGAVSAAAHAAARKQAPSWEGDGMQRTIGVRTGASWNFERPNELVERARGLTENEPIDLVLLTVWEFRSLCDAYAGLHGAAEELERFLTGKDRDRWKGPRTIDRCGDQISGVRHAFARCEVIGQGGGAMR